MDLIRKLKETTGNHTIKINDLEKVKKYKTIKAGKAQIKYGPAILLTTKNVRNSAKVSLPKCCTDLFTIEYTGAINVGSKKFCLMHHGTCERTKAYMLSSETL
jgi:hypothetical protein